MNGLHAVTLISTSLRPPFLSLSVQYVVYGALRRHVSTGGVLNEEEMYELLAAAVFMYKKRENINRRFLNQEK